MIEIHDKSQYLLIDTSPNLALTSHRISKIPSSLCIHAGKPPETERYPQQNRRYKNCSDPDRLNRRRRIRRINHVGAD